MRPLAIWSAYLEVRSTAPPTWPNGHTLGAGRAWPGYTCCRARTKLLSKSYQILRPGDEAIRAPFGQRVGSRDLARAGHKSARISAEYGSFSRSDTRRRALNGK